MLWVLLCGSSTRKPQACTQAGWYSADDARTGLNEGMLARKLVLNFGSPNSVSPAAMAMSLSQGTNTRWLPIVFDCSSPSRNCRRSTCATRAARCVG
ncbi:hypothetical protein D3C72_1624590 [compost metagenome]